MSLVKNTGNHLLAQPLSWHAYAELHDVCENYIVCSLITWRSGSKSSVYQNVQHIGMQDILEARQAAGMTLEDVMSLENDEEGRMLVQTACSLYAIAQLSLTSSTN